MKIIKDQKEFNELLKEYTANVELIEGPEGRRTRKTVSEYNYKFTNCEIQIPITIAGDITLSTSSARDYINRIDFIDCTFTESVQIIGKIEGNVDFSRCTFKKNLELSNVIFNKKVRLYICDISSANFVNTRFNDLADFWRSTFHSKVIFYKTDFLGVTVFSAARFKQNVLFTYSLIEKTIFFRGTVFENGLDLSLSVSTGDLGLH